MKKKDESKPSVKYIFIVKSVLKNNKNLEIWFNMETKTAYKYIVKKTDTKEPIIEGTRISVRAIVEQWKLGSTPEEISSIYSHINLSQVFEALAYYQDNMAEVEHFIQINKISESLSGKALSG